MISRALTCPSTLAPRIASTESAPEKAMGSLEGAIFSLKAAVFPKSAIAQHSNSLHKNPQDKGGSADIDGSSSSRSVALSKKQRKKIKKERHKNENHVQLQRLLQEDEEEGKESISAVSEYAVFAENGEINERKGRRHLHTHNSKQCDTEVHCSGHASSCYKKGIEIACSCDDGWEDSNCSKLLHSDGGISSTGSSEPVVAMPEIIPDAVLSSCRAALHDESKCGGCTSGSLVPQGSKTSAYTECALKCLTLKASQGLVNNRCTNQMRIFNAPPENDDDSTSFGKKKSTSFGKKISMPFGHHNHDVCVDSTSHRAHDWVEARPPIDEVSLLCSGHALSPLFRHEFSNTPLLRGDFPDSVCLFRISQGQG